MTQRMEKAAKLLKQSGITCILINNRDEIDRSALPGIRPLMNWMRENPDALKDACVADKVVGRAAAFLMIYGNVAEVYAAVLSESARQLLEAHHILYDFEKMVPHILNRKGTDLCPMEKCCQGIGDPHAAFEKLRQMTMR